jgi:hypothetical protein
MTAIPIRWGATQLEWDRFSLGLDLCVDLLPVVSNPNAKISPRSAIKEVGKTPSRYDREKLVVGIADWTSKVTEQRECKIWATEPDYGICVQTRRVRAIDIDVPDPAQAHAISAAVKEMLGELPTRTRSNSGKCLLAIEVAGELTKRRLTVAGGVVEFLATGQQFIAVGTHPSGVKYEWEGGLPDEIPTISLDAFELVWAMLQDRFGVGDSVESKPSTKALTLAEAYRADPLAQFLVDGGWVKRTDKTGALHIRCPWEDEHTGDSSDTATTYWPAHTGGYEHGGFKCQHAHCIGRGVEAMRQAIGYAQGDFENLDDGRTPEAAGPQGKPARFQVLSAAQFVRRPAPTWLIEDVLPQGELVVLFGESGAGKSFMALDLVMAIARGVQWRDREVVKGRVVYVCAEGSRGFISRLEAYAEHNNLDVDTLPVGFVVDAPNLLQRAECLEVASQIGRADVVVFDTFAQVTPGGNENSGEDMGLALSHCKGIHRATGATVLLVHHSGKDASKGARGWSGLRAAADAEFEVIDSGHGRSMTVTKQKDGETGEEFGFVLADVLLGVSPKGKPIVGKVVEHTGEVSKRKVPARGAVEKVALRVLGELKEAGPVSQAEWIDAAVENLPAGSPGGRDTRRQRVMRAVECLVALGHAVIVEGKVA